LSARHPQHLLLLLARGRARLRLGVGRHRRPHPHADFGEGVAAVVVADPAKAPSEAEILQALEGRLARFKQPKRVMIVPELPRNTMGKVQKNILRDTYAGLFAKGA